MSTVKIKSPNGSGMGTEVVVDGTVVRHLTGVDVALGVGQPNVVRLHMIAQAQDIEIEADVKIGGMVVPPAVELALLGYLDKKYADRARAVEVTGLDDTERQFAPGSQ